LIVLPSGLAFAVALTLAMMEWLAVARHWRRLEFVFKPATLVAVIIAAWLLTRNSHDTWMARFFLPGLILSLAGDIFLLLPGGRFFVLGLASFLLAHLCYTVGLNPTPPPGPALALVVPVAAIGLMLARGILSGLRGQGQMALAIPVALYGVVLSAMLISAWATLFRPEWTPLRQGMVIVGASLFFASDTMLAWNQFVEPLPSGRVRVMVTYHLAQMALAASIAL
jgi:uncharacterized membrane protein YhhN